MPDLFNVLNVFEEEMHKQKIIECIILFMDKHKYFIIF